MKITVLGCSGSVSGPDCPASGYLVDGPTGQFVMDLGPGTFGELQKYTNPSTVDLLLTHLHADHCLDIPALMIWRRYHPTGAAQSRNVLWGPADTALRVGHASAEIGEGIDDLSDSLELRSLVSHESFDVAGVTVTPFPMVHPIEAYGFRLDVGGRSLAYTGDTAKTDEVIEMARGADVLICEATWCAKDSDDPTIPPQMHMSGAEAGEAASRAGVTTLVLTHIPPYGDPEGAVEAASRHYDGEIIVAERGMVIDLP